MATVLKEQKMKWDVEAERQLINIRADILIENSRKMLKRKSKELIATQCLTDYIRNELNSEETYSNKAVSHKIDSLISKMYSMYQKKGETGKEIECSK